MSRYESLINKKVEALEKAKEHFTDADLRRFYLNAADGYQQKADALTAREAGAK